MATKGHFTLPKIPMTEASVSDVVNCHIQDTLFDEESYLSAWNTEGLF